MDNLYTLVVPGLYISTQTAAADIALLYELNVSHLIISEPTLPPLFPGDFTYKALDLNSDPVSAFDEAVSFIETAFSTANSVLIYE